MEGHAVSEVFLVPQSDTQLVHRQPRYSFQALLSSESSNSTKEEHVARPPLPFVRSTPYCDPSLCVVDVVCSLVDGQSYYELVEVGYYSVDGSCSAIACSPLPKHGVLSCRVVIFGGAGRISRRLFVFADLLLEVAVRIRANGYAVLQECFVSTTDASPHLLEHGVRPCRTNCVNGTCVRSSSCPLIPQALCVRPYHCFRSTCSTNMKTSWSIGSYTNSGWGTAACPFLCHPVDYYQAHVAWLSKSTKLK